MQKILFIASLFLVFISCHKQEKNKKQVSIDQSLGNIKYAQGFDIDYYDGYKVLTIKNSWPGSEKELRYALVQKGHLLDAPASFDEVISIPIEEIVVTSTTHIPSLEMLAVDTTLVGFPSLDYISSQKTRARINKGLIKELGKNEDLNTESLLDLNPDVIIGFAIDNHDKTLKTIKKTGIPLVYNGDWTESSPLAKAEWIKFFGAFYNKDSLANELFSVIESDYLNAKKIAFNAKSKPTVLSGAMYKDVWYLPQGKSWAAQFIADANGDYLWKETKGTGSHSLSLESVLDKAEHAEIWIGPSYYTNLVQLKKAHTVYQFFDAFKTNNVYSFTNKVGETGGLIYFELAPNRPDLVLKDIIKILHPELLPEHTLYFFDQLK
ncbi:MAG: ABC transporter substrate-binding protein [Flavobacteriales bacterium]|nr:MAG: ABC transporter substrate-binding protein [Flavobacteriales bacterium]